MRARLLSPFVLATVLFAGPASAGSRPFENGDHCTYGSARSIVGAYYPLGNAGPEPWSGYGALTPCEFRAFYTPPTEWCFCEDDVAIVGGDNHSFDGPRSEWFMASVGAEFYVTPEDVLGVQGFVTPVEAFRGGTLRRHYGVLLTDLVPGIYDVTIAYVPEGDPDPTPLWYDHTFIRILRHEEAHGEFLPLAGTATCPLEDHCDDGVDDDGDGLVDCDDTNCKRNTWDATGITETPCFAGSYDELGAETATTLWAGSTTLGGPDDWAFLFKPWLEGDCGWPGSGYAPDAAAHWTVPETGTYRFDLDSSWLIDPTQPFWSYLGISNGTDSWCSQGPIEGVQLQAGQEVTIVVDGVNGWDAGEFTLTAEQTP